MFQPVFVRSLMPSEREGLALSAKSLNREESARAQVILLSAEGKTAAEISQQIGSHPSNVKKWIRRFNEQGLVGVSAKKRGPQGGPRPRFTSEQTDTILRLSKTEPAALGYSFREWTPQKLATAAVERGIVDSISHVTVRQLLNRQSKAESPPQLTETKAEAAGLAKGREADQTDFELGEKALAQSRYDTAAERLYAALAKNTGSPEEEAITRSLLSKALEELSKYEEAQEVIGKFDDPRMLALLSPRTRARVRLRTGWVNSFLRDHAKAIAALNEARRLFLELGDDLGMSEAHYGLGRTYIEINEFRIARDHLVFAAGFQKTAQDPTLLAQIYNRLGVVDFHEGAFSSSTQNYLKALELVEGSGNTNPLGLILLNLGTSIFHGYPSEREESATYLKRAIECFEKGGHKDYLTLAYNNLGDNLQYAGQWREAIQALEKAIAVSQRFEQPSYEATARVTLAEILCAKGEFTGAESHLKRSLELIEGTDKWLECNALRVLAAVHRAVGRSDSALKTLRQALQLSTSIGDLLGVTLAQVGLADLHFSQGGYDQAREYLELAQERLKEEKSLSISGLIQRLTGKLEAASGRLPEAKQHIAQSVSIFTTTETTYELGLSHYEMGLLLRSARDLKGAESNLLRAREIFESLEAEPDFELCRKALASLTEGEDGSQVLRVSPLNDVLLMQRLIEASASRELLVRELAAVISENFPVEQVAIFRVAETGIAEPLARQGIGREDAEQLGASLDQSTPDAISRSANGYVIRIGDNSRVPILVYMKANDTFDVARLQPLFKQAELGLETCSLRATVHSGPVRDREQPFQTIMPGFIVASAPMFDVIDKIYKIRTNDVTVLITGESGTGKELVARHIHGQSARARAIFLPFNCTATPKEIIDSQLFGHRKGAFTGATTNYPGIIKAADGGTLFLDEIGDLSLEVQPKLMRFLQEGEIQPLGETKPGRVDVRILAATNTDLERAVEDGRFREDLFHRLNIIRIHVPPLRERSEEVPVLAAHFLEHFSSRSGKQGIMMTQDATDALSSHDWPGNVRQLRNEIERMVAYALDGARISVDDLSPDVTNPRREMRRERPGQGYAAFGGSIGRRFLERPNGNHSGVRPHEPRIVKLKAATAELERRLIQEALDRNRNNLSRTAVELGLSRRGLRLKLGQLGILREQRA
ncbi:MAG: sigma 54-interacting transcriptional regulator [Blastocatellia bacterium]